MQPAATEKYFKTPEFLKARKREHAILRAEIRGAERAIEWIYERGEEYPGEISKHLSDLDELRTREWFAGCLVSFIETGKMPPDRRYPGHTGQVTDLMIERARAYPIARLVEVKNGKALCPFHNDNNPSMSVKGSLYHCFSCNAGGDVIRFVMDTRKITFPEAVRALNV